eukprot:CAMPEP_0202977676 /NCGR_PEP_ID=MMETSP1396-20130829/84390_1 /ASSEMBLY_ACC=CAM_ASM_000872 /TAXON_ID= /ORGANISM="Pseudokeronopsis sp., Strain Brazil" /LENGTH=58 /DNA_ID=CAMNT_0049716465 /DNA_START=25 /DNA_END=201 /DNA_ORIENTATION=-
MKREKKKRAAMFFNSQNLSSGFFRPKYTISGTKKQILTQAIPPKMPSTLEIDGNFRDR